MVTQPEAICGKLSFAGVAAGVFGCVLSACGAGDQNTSRQPDLAIARLSIGGTLFAFPRECLAYPPSGERSTKDVTIERSVLLYAIIPETRCVTRDEVAALPRVRRKDVLSIYLGAFDGISRKVAYDRALSSALQGDFPKVSRGGLPPFIRNAGGDRVYKVQRKAVDDRPARYVTANPVDRTFHTCTLHDPFGNRIIGSCSASVFAQSTLRGLSYDPQRSTESALVLDFTERLLSGYELR